MRVGMIGVGGFGKYRRQRMRDSGLFELVACVDRNADALQEACATDHAKALTDFDALLAEPGLEGVVISTGIDTHTDLAIRAMRAGLHVFVEKPLCSSLVEIEQLHAVQEETSRVVGMGHNDNATEPVMELARTFLNDGRIGTAVCYEENSSHSGGLEINAGEWRGLRDRNPGGMLIQCGVHALHGLTHLFGEIDSVSAMMRYDAHPGTQTADAANVLIRHRSGLIGTLNCYHVTAYCHSLRLFGTVGNLFIDTYALRAWYQARKRNELETPVEVPVRRPQPSDSWSNLRSWHAAIRTGSRPSPSLEDGINAVLPVIAATRSDTERRHVSISELSEWERPMSDDSRLRVAVAQPLVVPGDVDANLASTTDMVHDAARRGAELVLFSECGLTGYDLKGSAIGAAIPLDHPSVERVRDLAHSTGVAVVTGLYMSEHEKIYNTAIACLPDRQIHVQRKHCIFGHEADDGRVSSGSEPHVIFAYRGFRIAILICADNGIKDIQRSLAARGCDLILAPTAGCGDASAGFAQAELDDADRREAFLRAAESVCFISPRMVLECGIALACCNQAGYVPASRYFQPGHSAVIDHTGETTALIPGRMVFEHLRADLAIGFVTRRLPTCSDL